MLKQYSLLFFAILLMAHISCGQPPKKQDPPADAVDRAEYFAVYTDSSDVDWREEIPVFHCWREDGGEDSVRVAEWKALCEDVFRPEPTQRCWVQGNFRSMNHYVTVYDFVNLWFLDGGVPEAKDDDFIIWRLTQYDPLATAGATAEERKASLRKTIDALLDFVPNTQWDVRFQESLKWEFDHLPSGNARDASR